jgi:hypothetical protein
VQLVTGKKLLYTLYDPNYSGEGIEEVRNANDDFKERIDANNFDVSDDQRVGELEDFYKEIEDYSDQTSLIESDKSEENNNLVSGLVTTIDDFLTEDTTLLQNELESKKQDLQNAVESTLQSVRITKGRFAELKLLVDASKEGLFVNFAMGENNFEQVNTFITDQKSKFSTIIEELESIEELETKSPDLWNSGINSMKNNLGSVTFSSDYQPNLTKFINKLNEQKEILGPEMEQFPGKLKNEITDKPNIRGGQLLEKGFFNLDASVVSSILGTKVTINNTEMRLMWGGYYNSSKDFMHFELRKRPGSENRPFQSAVHGVKMETIKEYLNSFTNKEGDNYDY